MSGDYVGAVSAAVVWMNFRRDHIVLSLRCCTKHVVKTRQNLVEAPIADGERFGNRCNIPLFQHLQCSQRKSRHARARSLPSKKTQPTE